MSLADYVLITTKAFGAYESEMAAGHIARPALTRSNFAGKVENLNVKTRIARVCDRIDVQVLPVLRPRRQKVNEVVIEYRIRTEEGGDNALNSRQSQIFTDCGGRSVAGRKRLERIRLWWDIKRIRLAGDARDLPLEDAFHLFNCASVDVFWHEAFEHQATVNDKVGHLAAGQSMVGS